MKRKKKWKMKQLLPIILVFTIVAVAYSCRMLAKFDIGGVYVSYIRAALYLLLFSLWGFSIDRRIIQTQALHCLRLTAALMLVWLVLRTLKYEVVTDLTVARYIWYLYYLPLLFIPLLGVYIALSLGKSDEFRLTGRIGALAIIPSTLFLLVITNDLHQQMFAFSSGVPGEPDNSSYTHGPVYFCCLGWMVICLFFSLILLLKKSRVPCVKKKKIIPFVIGCATVIYGILYLLGLPAVRWWFGDMNVMFCLLYAAIYESCIRCRMIQSNTGYVELFEATTLAACIADRNGNIVLRSRAADEDMVCPQDGLQIIRSNGIRISSAPISGGYAVWQDNVEPLTELRAKLSENKTKIKNNKEKLLEAYLIQKKLNELTEKNRIYDELETKYGKQIVRIGQLLKQCEGAEPVEIQNLLKRILLLGTYIKRGANLYFLSLEYEFLPQQELRLTVDEAVGAMTVCGTECSVVYHTTKPMLSSEVVRLLDLLKLVAETTIPGLYSLFISVSDSEMDLSVECAADLSLLASSNVTIRQEDGLWLIRTLIGGVNGA
ncbi:hypothetical protein NQ527_11360 [Eshraghiella crossota]|uniref:Histidine kinase N-terminal 7TM region domain-containing protein n=1 Tax=Eshraghiella crossota DSM 2876 TaxID=511680 RepID=D4RXF3_9FIRM|nr:histidine kinase N-terminal 7TM domain-containing protein [Butyrivibrio crossotus]EFF69315.1 hypothetical protein BUTYVIB_00504 [Butyrivibrio crossotus DSM 2876]UWO50504.1 hypothetical protein NQ527_11360 [Butyrivibrio crossotus]